MKNIPRIFIDLELSAGAVLPLAPDHRHYLNRVMRTNKFLAFNNGTEYEAEVIDNGKFMVGDATGRKDPSGKWTFCFAPVKRIEDLISGVVQMGAGRLQPVITDRTVARHVNWDRMRKIIIENCEQSGRNSIPELSAPVDFADLDKSDIIFGDERKLRIGFSLEHSADIAECANPHLIRNSSFSILNFKLLVGPEGGFSDEEFNALDAGGAVGVSLAPTILRAEVAAVALCACSQFLRVLIKNY